MPSISGSPDLASANPASGAPGQDALQANLLGGASKDMDPKAPGLSIHPTTPLGHAAMGMPDPGMGRTPLGVDAMPALQGGVPAGTKVARLEGGHGHQTDFTPSEAHKQVGSAAGLAQKHAPEAAAAAPLHGKEALKEPQQVKPPPHAQGPGKALAHAKDAPAPGVTRAVAQETPAKKPEAAPATGPLADKTKEALKEAQHDGSIFGPLKKFALDNPIAIAGLAAVAAAAMGGGWKWSLVAGAVGYLGTGALKYMDEKSSKAAGFDKIAELHGQGPAPAKPEPAPAKKG